MQENLVQLLGWEDPLEREIATHSGILTWKIPWTEEPGRLQSMVLQESDTTEQLRTCEPISCTFHVKFVPSNMILFVTIWIE